MHARLPSLTCVQYYAIIIIIYVNNNFSIAAIALNYVETSGTHPSCTCMLIIYTGIVYEQLRHNMYVHCIYLLTCRRAAH